MIKCAVEWANINIEVDKRENNKCSQGCTIKIPKCKSPRARHDIQLQWLKQFIALNISTSSQTQTSFYTIYISMCASLFCHATIQSSVRNLAHASLKTAVYHGKLNYHTVCPKVPLNSNVVLSSAICGQILKPLQLQIATLGRFDMMYDMPW